MNFYIEGNLKYINKKYYEEKIIYDDNDQIIIPKNIKPLDILKFINTNKEFTPNLNENIKIKFDDFYWFSLIKKSMDNFFSNQSKKNHTAGYNLSNQNIIIHQDFFSNNSIYNELSNNKLLDSEIINFVILHEIGHCLHHLSLDKNKIINYDSKESNFINTIMPNFDKTWIVKNHEIMERLNNSIVEGFADLYSLILLDKIYPDNQALKIIEAVKDVRKEKELYHKDTYHTYSSIEKYIKHRNEMKANLNDFHSINQYICQNTLQEAFSIIEKYTTPSFIESDSKHKKDVFLLSGVLYEAYNLKKENFLPDAESVLKYIKENNFLNHNIENNIEKIFDFNSLYPTYNSSFEIGRSEYLSTKNDGVLKNKIKNIKKMLNRDNDFNIHINKNNKSKYN